MVPVEKARSETTIGRRPLADWPHLVGDVGGTNARFAVVERPGDPITHPLILPSRDFSGLAPAVEAYITLSGAIPRSACVAVAGPVLGDEVGLTNVSWHFSMEETRVRLGLKRLLIVNDFLALAMAVPGLSADDTLPLGESVIPSQGGASASAKVVIGPGTGLGVALLIPGLGRPSLKGAAKGPSWTAVATEGGHVGVAPDDAAEAELLRIMRAGSRHVSAETVLSGPGLEALHQALAIMAGQQVPELRADEILRCGLDGSDLSSVATLTRFAGMLGSFAGNVVLTTGARGGLYVAGGVAQRLGPWLARSDFRRRFEDKGVMSAYLRLVPTFLITAAQPTFAGAARLLAE